MRRIGWCDMRAGLLVAVVVVAGCRGGSDLGPGVNQRSIRNLRADMTEQDAVSVIGEPFAKQADKDREGWVLWTYSRPVSGVCWYPMLWLHFQEGRLAGVYAKRKEPCLANEEGVFGWSPQTPTWEKKAFQDSFPR